MPRLVLLCLLPALLAAPPAAAAERTVPRGWLGVVADGPLTQRDDVAGEWDLMAGAGVESVRTAFYWPAIQRGGPEAADFAAADRVVLAAAARRIGVLPIVSGTPAWAARRPGDETSPPRDARSYGRFLALLVARYGPGGTLWAEHPEVPARPIREWQVWNEPNL